MSAIDLAMKAIMPLRNILDLAWLWGTEDRGRREEERKEEDEEKRRRARGQKLAVFPYSLTVGGECISGSKYIGTVRT